MPRVYEELRRIAAHCMQNERPGRTIQTTALVHEAYLKLIDITNVDWQHRVLGINGTENRVKVTRILQVLAGVPIPQATSSKASVGFRRGRRWPRATESGTENAYRPSKLMWSNTSGESRATSSGRTG